MLLTRYGGLGSGLPLCSEARNAAGCIPDDSISATDACTPGSPNYDPTDPVCNQFNSNTTIRDPNFQIDPSQIEIDPVAASVPGQSAGTTATSPAIQAGLPIPTGSLWQTLLIVLGVAAVIGGGWYLLSKRK